MQRVKSRIGGFVCQLLECARIIDGILCCSESVNDCEISSIQAANTANHEPNISESVIEIEPVRSMGPSQMWIIAPRSLP